MRSMGYLRNRGILSLIILIFPWDRKSFSATASNYCGGGGNVVGYTGQRKTGAEKAARPFSWEE
nr:MAG TPA: hypothetical protein [Caudoviricetes sp.]